MLGQDRAGLPDRVARGRLQHPLEDGLAPVVDPLEASERAGRSYIPLAFWYLSLVGTLILLVYAIHREEPIFLLGFLPNAFVYIRNIILIRRNQADGSPSGSPDPETHPAGS